LAAVRQSALWTAIAAAPTIGHRVEVQPQRRFEAYERSRALRARAAQLPRARRRHGVGAPYNRKRVAATTMRNTRGARGRFAKDCARSSLLHESALGANRVEAVGARESASTSLNGGARSLALQTVSAML